MSTVVFTGTARDKDNNVIYRSALEKACDQVGFVVQSKVSSDTDVLIASRTDTVKAKQAKEMNISVFEYPKFLSFLSKMGVDLDTLNEGSLLNPYTDTDPVETDDNKHALEKDYEYV